MEKICCRCKELKDISMFDKNSSTKDSLSFECKLCKKEYRDKNKLRLKEYRTKNKVRLKEAYIKYCEKNKVRIRENYIRYRDKNKLRLEEYYAKYYSENRNNLIGKSINYRLKNLDKVSITRKKRYENDRERVILMSKKYYLENKEERIRYSINNACSPAKYDTYADRLTIDECPILHNDGIHLEVKCKYCGKYFIPTNGSVKHRIKVLHGTKSGDGSLYCSDGCKNSCPIYKQIKYPKGFKKASSREVDSILRQMCFERDNWECQICGKSVEEVILHCHHIEGYTQNPLLGNDIDNVITLCKSHHKEVHKLPGCGYYELQCVGELS
jgi:hypothetical protein